MSIKINALPFVSKTYIKYISSIFSSTDKTSTRIYLSEKFWKLN
jgi:hypothetical protein